MRGGKALSHMGRGFLFMRSYVITGLLILSLILGHTPALASGINFTHTTTDKGTYKLYKVYYSGLPDGYKLAYVMGSLPEGSTLSASPNQTDDDRDGEIQTGTQGIMVNNGQKLHFKWCLYDMTAKSMTSTCGYEIFGASSGGGGEDPPPLDTTPPEPPYAWADATNHRLLWTMPVMPSDIAGYKIYKNGFLQDTIYDPNVFEYPFTAGEYADFTVTAFDQSGNNSSPSNPVRSTGGGGGPVNPPGNNECDVCGKLAAMLECPGWDQYMGELTGAIRSALPTIPEWRNIAQVFVDQFSDYFGSVPPPPSVAQIENQIRPNMPALNTSVPAANIVPTVPADFNQPIPFDITTGPEIPVVDESRPIEIYAPDRYINADSPGQMVFPGDERNNSGGIKPPDRINTGYDTPAPTRVPVNPDIPPSDMPIPGGSSGTIPMPSNPGGVIPIPERRG